MLLPHTSSLCLSRIFLNFRVSLDAEMVNNSKVSTESKLGFVECGNKNQARLGVKLGAQVEWAGASGCMQWGNGTEMCRFGFVITALNSCSFGSLTCSSVLTSVVLLASRLAN